MFDHQSASVLRHAKEMDLKAMRGVSLPRTRRPARAVPKPAPAAHTRWSWIRPLRLTSRAAS